MRMAAWQMAWLPFQTACAQQLQSLRPPCERVHTAVAVVCPWSQNLQPALDTICCLLILTMACQVTLKHWPRELMCSLTTARSL